MICECDVTLDDRGFLFDQVNVDNYFKGIRESKLSCEKLVMSCAKTLLRMIRLENPRCKIRKMSLTLSPQPFMASMTYDWSAASGKKTGKTKSFIDI
jgi:hypothetical protein